jgi:hypothetical protein
MRFELPFLLWAAPGVAVGVALLAWWALRRRIVRSQAWSAELGALARRGRASSVPLLAAAALAAAIAAAGPRGGRGGPRARRRPGHGEAGWRAPLRVGASTS